VSALTLDPNRQAALQLQQQVGVLIWNAPEAAEQDMIGLDRAVLSRDGGAFSRAAGRAAPSRETSPPVRVAHQILSIVRNTMPLFSTALMASSHWSLSSICRFLVGGNLGSSLDGRRRVLVRPPIFPKMSPSKSRPSARRACGISNIGMPLEVASRSLVLVVELAGAQLLRKDRGWRGSTPVRPRIQHPFFGGLRARAVARLRSRIWTIATSTRSRMICSTYDRQRLQ
jgi:hypothetical protein